MEKSFIYDQWVRVAACNPNLHLGNPKKNINEIFEQIKESNLQRIKIIVFPELSLCGYSCGDLFYQSFLVKECMESLIVLLEMTKNLDIIVILGMPINFNDRLYNSAVVLKMGKILGIVPKIYLPNSNEFYEQRWFTSGYTLKQDVYKSSFFEYPIPIGIDILFFCKNYNFKFGIELCEDLWSVIPNSSLLSLAGAEIIFNLSASNELVGKSSYRRNLVLQQSAKCNAAYIYASSGFGESTTDTVYSGHCLIAENGKLLSENTFNIGPYSNFIYADLDIDLLIFDRLKNTSFSQNNSYDNYKIIDLDINTLNQDHIKRPLNKTPFIPFNLDEQNEVSQEIFSIQVAALKRRLLHIGVQNVIIGISGGLDSTLALLVIVATFDSLNFSRNGIIAVTMPGFGTSSRTYDNAVFLIKSLNCTFKEISIKESTLLHFTEIEHDPNTHNVVFENAQARQRTLILMNLANKYNGIVIGTGDLSESALGWCTFNGDHISMYHINIGIPKTLVQYIIKYCINLEKYLLLKEILEDILITPISPELLPLSSIGEQLQSTESILGNYQVHDFFLYYFLRCGSSPKKIFLLANKTYENIYSKEYLLNCLEIFYKRFFSQQFKRSVMPDGPKIGTVSLSPRTDWRMPSDISYQFWIDEVNKLKTQFL